MLLLGVDGGGSKTAALAVNERGQVVGWGIGGGSNYHTAGLDGMFANVSQAVNAALNGAIPDGIAYCLAAADMPHDFVQLRGKLDGLIEDRPFNVYNDVIGIFRAGSRFPYGVGVVCGTGFNAGGISKQGEEFRFPALGGVTGDYAGGEHLTFRAVGAAFRAWDGRGEPTMLADALLKEMDAPDFETLAERWVRREFTGQQVRKLAPLVFEVCEQGDAVARQLIRDEGVELGISAVAALRRLDLMDEDCDVVLGGSMAHGKGRVLMNAVTETVHASAPKAKVGRLDVPPVVGAVLLAADQIGFATDAAFQATIRATLPAALRVPNSGDA